MSITNKTTIMSNMGRMFHKKMAVLISIIIIHIIVELINKAGIGKPKGKAISNRQKDNNRITTIIKTSMTMNKQIITISRMSTKDNRDRMAAKSSIIVRKNL